MQMMKHVFFIRSSLLILVCALNASCSEHTKNKQEPLPKVNENSGVTGASVFLIPEDEMANLEKAAKAGDSNAAHRLALHYMMTDGTVWGERKQEEWLGLAADLGHPGALHELALIYEQRLLKTDECRRVLQWRMLANGEFKKDSAKGYLGPDVEIFDVVIKKLCADMKLAQ
jgi:hypothetical protein